MKKTPRIKLYIVLFALAFLIVPFCGCAKKNASVSVNDGSIKVKNDEIVVEVLINKKDSVKDETNENPELYTDEEQPIDNEEAVDEDEELTAELREEIEFDTSWLYADYSEIHSGNAVLYRSPVDRRNIVIGVNAGHGTDGGTSVKTFCHPDKSPKVTGGSTAEGSIKATAVSSGMTFLDGTKEESVTLREAQILRDMLIQRGYDVLMVRDDTDVQLDNVARTVLCNNIADCHIALHWDGDNLDYDKGCFYISVPDGIKYMEPVASTWKRSEELGEAVISGLRDNECKICNNGSMDIDLTQTSYSTVPSIDLELGNVASNHDDPTLAKLAEGICNGIERYNF